MTEPLATVPEALSARLSFAAGAVTLIGVLGALIVPALAWVTLTDGFPLFERIAADPVTFIATLVIPFALIRAGHELHQRRRSGALLAIPALLIGPVPILFGNNSWGGYWIALPLVAILLISCWRELR
jgi:uncharacterized membrane protein